MINIDPRVCVDNYDNAKKLMRNSLNFFHAMIYSIPRNKDITKKFNKSLKRFQLLLKRILDTYMCRLII